MDGISRVGCVPQHLNATPTLTFHQREGTLRHMDCQGGALDLIDSHKCWGHCHATGNAPPK
jgi:hypothetical protein